MRNRAACITAVTALREPAGCIMESVCEALVRLQMGEALSVNAATCNQEQQQ
jgi:hypothetical protein